MCKQVDAFLRRHPQLADPWVADNQCKIAADQLIEELTAQGVGASAVWVRGHRVAPDTPAPRAMASDRHMLVRLPDGSFVDVTRRQFDPNAQHPTYYASERELASHWREVDRGPVDGREENEDWERLARASA